MYRKVSAFLAACMICCGVCASCGSKSSSSVSGNTTQASTTTETVSEPETTTQPAAEDSSRQVSGGGSQAQITPETAKGGDITGQWVPESFDSSLDLFLEFGPDGSGSVFADLSKMVTLSNGKFSAMGIEASGDDLVVKDGTVSAYYNNKDEDSLIIRLERIDGSTGNSLDGEYKITGGRLADTIYAYLDGSFGGDADKLPITAVVDGSSTFLKISGAFTYVTDGNKLDLEIMDDLSDLAEGIAGKDIYYTAENDKLMLTAGGESITMPRRK